MGPAVITAIVVIPVGLWWAASPTPAGFSDFSQIALSLGRVCALAGASLFMLNFILAARWKLSDKVFAGLDRMYFYHHYIGAAALILLLAHPVLLSLQYFPIGWKYVFKFFIPSRGAVENSVGAAALTVILVLLYITFFTKLKYQIWKFTHQFLAVALGLAILHMLLVPGNLSENLVLKSYMMTMAALAGYAVVYRILWPKKLVAVLRYRVEHVARIHPQITEIILTPVGKRLEYIPGQFIFISVDSPDVIKEQHPFTLTSSPDQKKLSLAIKNLGDYTETIKQLRAGTTVTVEGPYGAFSYLNTANTRQVWIAGGIGITPFLSMSRSLLPGDPYNIRLIFNVKQPADAVYAKELNILDKKNTNFQFLIFNSTINGRIDAEKIKQFVPDLAKREVFICGSLPMMKALRRQLTDSGIRPGRIHIENFALYESK